MYKRILIVVDGRTVSRAAVAEGTELARAQGAEVLFFSALPRYEVPFADMPVFADISPQQFEREAKAGADRFLAAAAVVADRAGVMWRKASGAGEDPAHVIVDAAKRRRCDLIVVASEGRNALLRLLTGSVIPGLITAAPMPVMVVKERDKPVGRHAAVVPPARRKAARRKPALS